MKHLLSIANHPSLPGLRHFHPQALGINLIGRERGVAHIVHQVRAAAVISLASFLQVADPFGDDSELQKLNTNVDIVQQLLMVS